MRTTWSELLQCVKHNSELHAFETMITLYSFSYNLFCGDMNVKYENPNRLLLLDSLKTQYKFVNTNDDKIKTFEEDQLDYIIYYGNKEPSKYELKNELIVNESDHHLLFCELEY